MIKPATRPPPRRVCLEPAQRLALERVSSTGVRPAKTVLRARALLLLDAAGARAAWDPGQVAAAVGLSQRALRHLKASFFARGMDAALQRKPRASPPRKPALDADAKSRLLALACKKPPAGRKRWSLRLLRDKALEQRIVAAVSPPTLARPLAPP
ncbi:MAG: helix-turn-helix domain-containing protein, partial [Kiritimatiellaeota bacterium]|nr:helix-turn-helix domain-containing protein [Kiritimatiellota bacterium]